MSNPSTRDSGHSPTRLILDTDMGNDIDDALALAMIHSLQSLNECRLIGVTVSKDNAYAPVYVDIVNTFYGHGHIPIGAVARGKTPEDGAFIRKIAAARDNGDWRYDRSPQTEKYEDAVTILRRILAGQPAQSVVLVMIGFSTNLARLLASDPDEVCDQSGRALFAEKIRHVVMMGADFSPEVRANPTLETREYNIHMDVTSAQQFVERCPAPIVFSGFEVGQAIPYPGADIEQQCSWTTRHPVVDAYKLFRPMPYDRPSWDLTAVLAAVRHGAGYFDLSEPGKVNVADDGTVHFSHDPDGSHRYLIERESERQRIVNAMVSLVTKPVSQGQIKIDVGKSSSVASRA